MPNPSILRPDFVASPRRVRVVLGGEVIAQSEATVLVRGARTIPIYYFPQTDVNTEFLKPSGRVEAVDTKRDATYWNVAAGGKSAENAAWSFTTPTPEAKIIKEYVAFANGPVIRRGRGSVCPCPGSLPPGRCGGQPAGGLGGCGRRGFGHKHGDPGPVRDRIAGALLHPAE
jgi:uncharacterized protein (DUF427 family)